MGGALALLLAAAGARAEGAPASPRPGDAPAGLEQGRFLSSFSFSGQRGPVAISAKTLEFDYRARQLTFQGEVTVAQDDMTLRSNVLRVVLDEKAQDRVRSVVAEGAVRITKGDRVATGGRATFEQATRTVVLSEGAVLREGANELAGDELTVFLDEERSVINGGKDPVHMVLVPSAPPAGVNVPAVVDREHAE